jgi:hypothetical protein
MATGAAVFPWFYYLPFEDGRGGLQVGVEVRMGSRVLLLEGRA